MSKRRKRNKRKKDQGIMFPAPLAAVLVVAGVLSLSYLWLSGRCEAMGREIKGLEKEHTNLRRRVMNEEYKWSNMKSPKNVEKLMNQHDLAMSWPEENHVIRIHMPSSGTVRVASDYSKQYVYNAGISMND